MHVTCTDPLNLPMHTTAVRANLFAKWLAICTETANSHGVVTPNKGGGGGGGQSEQAGGQSNIAYLLRFAGDDYKTWTLD